MRRMVQTGTVFEVRSASPDLTMAFGRRLGAHLRTGDVVLLFAPFGAGKTHLTKGIAAAFGVDPDDVNSPSFVLVNQYDGARAHGRITIYHVDLYRIDTPDDLATIGLDDLVNDRSLVVVEWAEHADTLLPGDHLAVSIEIVGEQERVLRLEPHGEHYQQLVEALRNSDA